ncbi:MAG: alpha/beta hydrolase [Pseudomonadota bacterium]
MIGTDIRYTSKDGLSLYAKSYGPEDADLTVLCMHGLTRNHKDFDPMIEALAAPHRFISVDVRGRGLSDRDPNPKNYTPMTYAGDMQTLLDTLGIGRAALVGTSMGGLMSVLMARKMKGRLRGVVLNDVGPKIEPAGIARIAGYVGKGKPVDSWQAAADEVARIQAEPFPTKTADEFMALARRTFRETEDGRLEFDYDPAIMSAVAGVKTGWWTSFVAWRLFGALKQCPLLIVRGGISDLLSAETLTKMVKRHGNAQSVTVPNVGHAPLLDEPEAVEGIRSFLATL